ncbi:MAG: 23S rRNA (adenine(2503)-C(2))-methyltransferase RlmN [Enterobacteriaceae bacterium]
MFSKKLNILNVEKKKLNIFLSSINEKSFRSSQIMKWIYQIFLKNFDKMSNLPLKLRENLKKFFFIKTPKVLKKLISSDGTIKFLMKLEDNQIIEAVYIPKKKKSTLCISSQVGCMVGCNFCYTSAQGFNRNLYLYEIIGQVWNVFKILGRNLIKNVVFMGMGEPLFNLKNVVSSIKLMMDNSCFNISRKNIIVSTSGIVPAIYKFSNELNIPLSVSLHAPNDNVRNKIMPINKKYNISKLLRSLEYYLSKPKNKKLLTIEYIMINNLNDKKTHACQLLNILKKIKCKVNLIPLNNFPKLKYKCSKIVKIRKFFKLLVKNKIITTIRKQRGNDIYASCGQLAGKINNKLKKIQ